MSKLVGVKVSRYEKERGDKHVDRNGKYPYFSDLMTAALTKFNDELEEVQKS